MQRLFEARRLLGEIDYLSWLLDSLLDNLLINL